MPKYISVPQGRTCRYDSTLTRFPGEDIDGLYSDGVSICNMFVLAYTNSVVGRKTSGFSIRGHSCLSPLLLQYWFRIAIDGFPLAVGPKTGTMALLKQHQASWARVG